MWLVVVALAAAATVLFLFLIRHFNHWMKNGVPYEHPLPFFGNLKDVVLHNKHIAFYLKEVYQQHKEERYRGIFALTRPVLVALDLELVRNVLAKDSHVFLNHSVTVAPDKDPLIHKNLFSLKGPKWKRMRMNLAPTFTASKIKGMFALVEEIGREMGNALEQDDPVSTNDVMLRYVTDGIVTCAMGIDRHYIGQLHHQLKKVLHLPWLQFVGSMMAAFAPELMNVFRIRLLNKELADVIRDLIWTTVADREKHGANNRDFLDSMMEMRKLCKQSGESEDFDFQGDDFVAQPFGTTIAAIQTCSSAMTFTLYELALHPEIQERLRDEILEVLERHEKEVTYEAMQEMKYLDMVICETLRKYPVIPFLDRVPVTDYVLPGSWKEADPVMLRKGIPVYIPVFAIHHDPEYYPHPEKFDPERFTEENKQKRPSFTFLPFGEGPRICIGMRFGLMQIKIGLIHILSRFQVEPCNRTPVPLQFQGTFLLHPKGPVPLSIKRIQQIS